MLQVKNYGVKVSWICVIFVRKVNNVFADCLLYMLIKFKLKPENNFNLLQPVIKILRRKNSADEFLGSPWDKYNQSRPKSTVREFRCH